MPSPERPALAPGLYERLVTTALKRQLDVLESSGHSQAETGPLDTAEAAVNFAQHVEGLVARALDGLPQERRLTRQAELESNVCACAACPGSECTCGCQNAAARPSASCQCGEVCSCGPTCTCKGCQPPTARRSEGR